MHRNKSHRNKYFTISASTHEKKVSIRSEKERNEAQDERKNVSLANWHINVEDNTIFASGISNIS